MQRQGNHLNRLLIKRINKSWANLKRIEEWIYIAATRADWSEVRTSCQTRDEAVNEHFQSYPVCSETSFFYKAHLKEHFHAENTIKHLRKKAVKNCLRLVH